MEALKHRIPDYARDLRLNLASVLTPQRAPGLSEAQLWVTALASAIAARNGELMRAVEAEATARHRPLARAGAGGATCPLTHSRGDVQPIGRAEGGI